MPVFAIGRTNSGMFASRASAADVHRTGTGSLEVNEKILDAAKDFFGM